MLKSIHPNKFFNSVNFVKSSWIGYVEDHMTSYLKNLHPSQVVGEIIIPMFKVRYSYTTTKGRKKEHDKYIFLAEENNDNFMEVEIYFMDEIEKYNKANPHRAFSNVQILDIRPISQAQLRIGI